jgi:hypothetical protein
MALIYQEGRGLTAILEVYWTIAASVSHGSRQRLPRWPRPTRLTLGGLYGPIAGYFGSHPDSQATVRFPAQGAGVTGIW